MNIKIIFLALYVLIISSNTSANSISLTENGYSGITVALDPKINKNGKTEEDIIKMIKVCINICVDLAYR